jgi:uracil-DNA glycosylase
MLLPIWEWLEAEIFNLPAETAGARPCFNPYRGIDPTVDQPGADCIRRDNLWRYLESFTAWPEIFVIGEAPGWRGCRFSGIPFTSEAQIVERWPVCGLQSSLAKQPYREAAATIFWRVMRDYHPYFLAWNSLPLHPHQPGQPLSNRSPSQSEIRQAETGLAKLIELLHPRRVIAVGKSAVLAMHHLEVAALAVRHPGHGGSKSFEAGMRDILGEKNLPVRMQALSG